MATFKKFFFIAAVLLHFRQGAAPPLRPSPGTFQNDQPSMLEPHQGALDPGPDSMEYQAPPRIPPLSILESDRPVFSTRFLPNSLKGTSDSKISIFSVFFDCYTTKF